MSEEKPIAPDMQEVVAHLEKAGFQEICPGNFAYRLDESITKINGKEFVEWPVAYLFLEKDFPVQDLEEMRQRAAHLLLDARYRNFESKIEVKANHYRGAPAEHTPESYNGCIVIEFHNGIQKFTAEEIEQAIASTEKARSKAKEQDEKANRKRELVSLDKGLRKAGLID